jgi:succinoglycan biosynthesis transport protein ExoP
MVQADAIAHSATIDSGRPFGFADCARLLRERARIVRNVALGLVALTILALLIWPSSYSSTAVVMLDPRKNNITDRSEVLSELPTDPSSVQNQIQILTSRDLADQVIRRLKLDDDKEFNRALASFPLNLLALGLTADEQHSMIVDGFLKHLKAEAEGLSSAVSVSFSAEEPEKSAQIANAVVDAYVAEQIRQKSDAARHSTEWLSDRIRELSRQAEAAEAAVQAYTAVNDLNDAGQGTQSLVDQQLGAINTQLVQVRADLAEKQATYEHVAGLVKSGRAADVSQVVASPLMVQLREQQADAIRNSADLDSKYGPKHPKRIAAESQLRDLDSKVEQEAERIAGSAANDMAVARAQVQSLEASLARAREQSNTQNFARVKLRAMEANAASTRTMYESFVTRLREAQDQGAVDMPDARIISHATVPARPSSPPRLIIFCASIPAGFLLGLLCALAMERMGYEAAPRARSREAAEGFAVPILGVVPDALAPWAADQIVSRPSSPFAQRIFAIADRLVAPRGLAQPHVIFISGPERNGGHSNVAVGLARALAFLRQKVILVDADFTVPAAARTMGLNRTPSGLLDVLSGTAPLSSAVARDTRSNALVMTSTAPPRNPAALWAAEETRAFLEHLRKTCDFVVIDAPADADAPAIAALADAVLVVGTAGNVPRLKNAAAALAGPGRRSVGIVLTR